eukprot:scaffold14691_cov124-Isochrysis_galbana.AAC.3
MAAMAGWEATCASMWMGMGSRVEPPRPSSLSPECRVRSVTSRASKRCFTVSGWSAVGVGRRPQSSQDCRSSRLTMTYSFLGRWKPRFGIREIIDVCPPDCFRKPWLPARARLPFMPRPLFRPRPEPMPRPMRVFLSRAPASGPRSVVGTCSGSARAISTAASAGGALCSWAVCRRVAGSASGAICPARAESCAGAVSGPASRGTARNRGAAARDSGVRRPRATSIAGAAAQKIDLTGAGGRRSKNTPPRKNQPVGNVPGTQSNVGRRRGPSRRAVECVELYGTNATFFLIYYLAMSAHALS